MLKAKIKSFIRKKMGKDSKKNIENLAVFLVLLIVTVVAINMIWKDEDKEGKDYSYKVLANVSEENSNNFENEEYNLEEKLEDILCKMEGVGKTKVLITYSETSEVVPMYSQSESTSVTEETDSGGGTRKQETSNLNKEVITNSNNDAITKTVVLPKVEGVIVIAKGAKNVAIKTNIIQAVSAVTGVATYKVQVFPMED